MTITAHEQLSLAAARRQLRERRTHGPKAWRSKAQTGQVMPDGCQRWYLRGGRGSGKTWSGSRNFAEKVREHPVDPDGNPTEWAAIGPTFGDARDTLIENPRSGLLSAFGLPPGYRGWNRSQGQLRLPTGQLIYADGADDGALRIQGKNLSGVWADEIGLWKKWELAWDESIRYAVRIHPKVRIVTGTPKRHMPARKLIKRIIDDPDWTVSLRKTSENVHLDQDIRDEFEKLRGTALAAQELDGDLILEVAGALWTPDDVAAFTVPDTVELPDFDLVVVSVDPAVASDGGGWSGIGVHGRVGGARTGHGWTVHSQRCDPSPKATMRRAAQLAELWSADSVVIEENNGGDYLPAVLEAVDPTLRWSKVRARVSKIRRAEVLQGVTQAGRWTLWGAHEQLVDEMCSFTGDDTDDSPDVLDQTVWAAHKLFPPPDAAAARPRRKARLVA